jgi:simple sugar transport system permease protein
MSASVRPRGRLRVERRPHVAGLVWFRVGGALFGLALALVALPLYASGSSGALYSALWSGTFGSALGWGDVLMAAAPLILTGLACSLPYRIGLWNVGADGQLYVGAWVASAIAFSLPHLSPFALIPAMLVGAVIGGMAWILVPALARALLGVNEIVTTLMLNFVALYWLTYWASGPWAEQSSVGGVQSRLLPGQAELANIGLGPVTVHWGILLAVGIGLLAAVVLRVTRFGFELPILGASERAGVYAGIATRRRMVQVLLLGGAMAGLAGVVEMTGTVHQYSSALSDNTGYSGIVVAIVAAGSELGVIAIAILFAAISVGGVVLSTNDVASGVGTGLFGAILLFAAIGDSLARYRITRVARPRATAGPAAPDPALSTAGPIGAPPA